MNESRLRDLLEAVRGGGTDVEQALAKLRGLPFEDLEFAKLDHHRAIRCGLGEVVFCQNKTTEQVAVIVERLAERGDDVLATRASREQFEAVAQRVTKAFYHESARMITVRQCDRDLSDGTIAVLSAGTSDQPVAEEARITAEMMNQRVEAICDVGVAGIHRLFAHAEALQRANVCVVVAGMEGALPSVVAGLVACPVIAVPTSVGYGASFGGIAALLTMLNSCASGVTVVNIDNGFGAGCTAAMINRLADRGTTQDKTCP